MDDRTMSKETTAKAEPTNEITSTPDQDWGKITAAVVISVIVAVGVHYVVFAGMNLSPTVHAFVGAVLFFITGFVTFGVIYH